MNFDLLISDLTNICVYQAEVIKAQACVLEELGVEVIKKEDMEHLNELWDTVKNWRT